MGRPSKGGAHKVTSKGIEYWYAWKGGPRVHGPPGSKSFQKELAALRSGAASTASAATVHKAPTLADVAAAYLASEKYSAKAERTQQDYRKLLDVICRRFGDLEVAALHEAPDETRGFFLDWRDELAKRSKRQADYAWSALNIVLNWGKQRGRIKLNPCRDAGVGGLYSGTRRDRVWTAADVDAFSATASAEVRLGLMLAYWTGQRQGDLLRLPWRAYDGGLITLTQSKGGVPVGVPVAAPLKAILDETQRRSDTIMVNQDGRPWSEHGYQHMVYVTKIRAGLRDLRFHDLRGTVASDLAEAGCTEAEITAVTGHRLIKNQVLDRHYLKRSIALARTAIAKLEAHRSGFVFQNVFQNE